MDRAGLVEAIRVRLTASGFGMIPGSTDQWGSRTYHRRVDSALFTAELQFSSHFCRSSTVNLWLGRTLGPASAGSMERVGSFLTAAEQSAAGVVDAQDRGDAWWSGYTGEVADGIASAIAIAMPRFLATPPANDRAREDELLASLRTIAAAGDTEEPDVGLSAVSPPAGWLAAADAWNMSQLRGRIGVKSRAQWARQTARQAWQHRQAGLI